MSWAAHRGRPARRDGHNQAAYHGMAEYLRRGLRAGGLAAFPLTPRGALFSRKTAPATPLSRGAEPLPYSLPCALFRLSGSRNGGLEKSL
ncbi:hypothetical protein LMG28614_04845 [Paraburkholderia ultramafica]|uniref:Uncharacterized protein n=1 Tax=Paraburkholderia ultramafica TaxID=1544867 RepID=A0A6S7BQ24_9BURK|nr:hypothetical protein LMG28614_04845 [Paraburkholderia ultramafica]